KAIGDNLLSRLLVALNVFLIKLSPGLFAYQSFVTARPLPTVSTLIDRAREAATSIPMEEKKRA
ncbi:MAG: hypothetical protein JSW39_06760, partial [Desulfobacterales bacterium]